MPLTQEPMGMSPEEYLEVWVEGASPQEWMELARLFLQEMGEPLPA